jgi:hypothetical protein
MSETITRIYYRIRFPAKVGTGGEFYSTVTGNSTWSSLGSVKGLLSRGKPYGYHGRLREPFSDYEVIEVTERVRSEARVLPDPLMTGRAGE